MSVSVKIIPELLCPARPAKRAGGVIRSSFAARPATRARSAIRISFDDNLQFLNSAMSGRFDITITAAAVDIKDETAPRISERSLPRASVSEMLGSAKKIDGRTKAGKLAKAKAEAAAAAPKTEAPQVRPIICKPWQHRCHRSRSRHVAVALYAIRAKREAAAAAAARVLTPLL